MKASKHVKRISFGSVVVIVVAVITVMAYRTAEPFLTQKPEATLEAITTGDYLIGLEELEGEEVTLVDIRNPIAFEKGHLENAMNIPTPAILDEEQIARFDNWKALNSTVVLYGKDVAEANMPFLMLYQMGYENVKLLKAELSYAQNTLVTTPAEIEEPIADIRAFIVESAEKTKQIEEARAKELAKAAAAAAAASAPPPPPKEVTPVKKKKKRPVEGGC